MTRHKDSPALIEHFQKIVSELIPPLRSLVDKHESSDAPSGSYAYGLVANDFLDLGGFLVSLDGDSLKFQALLVWDIAQFFGEKADNLLSLYSNAEILEYWTNKTTTDTFDSSVAFYLNMFDKKHQTYFSLKARKMFVEFAKILCITDDKPLTKLQTETLSNFEKKFLQDQVSTFNLTPTFWDDMPKGLSSKDQLLFISKHVYIEDMPDNLDLLQKVIFINSRIEETEKLKKDEHKEITLSFDEETEIKDIDVTLNELKSLIGLEGVKNDIAQLINFLKVQQMREEKGLPVQPLSRHLVFYGNPGTGKTTVARFISQIYKSLGILSEGHLVETDRAGLVAGYVGQTAIKVQEIVSEAIGGVLFIDEAYALSTGGDNDFGREAIETLLKMMEDNRDDLVVIVAGYTDKMSAFLQTNPGLRSRFNKYFEFQDYNPEQLVDIFELFCKNGGYKLNSTTHDELIKLFSVLYETRDDTFGNGRLARNLYEITINNQANRIVTLPHVDDDILSSIEESDIPEMADVQRIR